MKLNTIRASGLMLGLPILGSFLFSACGGDSGGGTPTINTNQNPPTNFSLSLPADNASDVCTFPTFKVHFPEHKDCGISDLGKVIGIFPTGATQSIGVSQAFPSATSDGGCDYSFNPAQSLPGRTQVKWGVLTASSGVSLDPKFVTFTTADANVVSCGGSNTRFILEKSIPDQFAKGSTDIGSTGIYDASTNEFNIDWKSLANLVTSQFSVASFLGFGTMSHTDNITLIFNQQPNLMLLKASIKVYEIVTDENTMLPKVGNPVSGISVVPVEGAGAGFAYSVIPPPAGGWSAGHKIMYLNKTAVSITGQALTDKNSSTARAYVGQFTVSQ